MMNLPEPLTMWWFAGPGPTHHRFFLPVLVEAHEIVAVQYYGEDTLMSCPIPPDFSWVGDIFEFVESFRAVTFDPRHKPSEGRK